LPYWGFGLSLRRTTGIEPEPMAKLPCPPELWPEFSSLLDRALDLPTTEQLRWVDSLGAEHDAVRPWLRQLLSTDTPPSTRDFLDVVVHQNPPTAFGSGQIIGPFALQSLLGRGGMGEVWKAVRRDDTVALKLPHAYLLNGVQKLRFERERDILAMLSHVHIAQLYSAGVADSHSYLEMELVDGVPITQYCKDKQLSLQERLNLFLQVLNAVGYAHGRLIAHRDLKPSNILVSSDGQVKLLDFGVASMLGGDTHSDLTQAHRAPVTLDYAAPEQLAGKPATVAVDIYALGVILQELLTGKRPKVAETSDAPTSLASHSVDTTFSETVGQLPVTKLRKLLAGDLDAILAKALEYEPQARYLTAGAFAEDLAAHLDLRSITALRISRLSRLWKFVRRHGVGVSLAASLILTLILSSAAVGWQAVRAERAAHRATVTKDFLISIFRASDPRVSQDKPRGTITARELLDQSVARIEKEFANDPEMEIELLGTVASLFYELGDRDHAYELWQRRVRLVEKQYDPLSKTAIDALLDELDAASTSRDGGDTAAQLLADVDRRITAAHLDHSSERAKWWWCRMFYFYHSGAKATEVDDTLDRAIEVGRLYSPNSRELFAELVQRGTSYISNARHIKNGSPLAAAERDFQEAAVIALHTSDPIDDGRIGLMMGVGQLLWLQGNIAGADIEFTNAEGLVEKAAQADSSLELAIAMRHGRMVHQTGDCRRANAIFESRIPHLPAPNKLIKLDVNQRKFVALFTYEYAAALSREGNLPKAIPILESVIATESSLPEEYVKGVYLPRANLTLGDTFDRDNQIEKAKLYLSAGFNMFSKPGPINRPLGDMDREIAQERWAQFLGDHGEPAEARRLLNEVINTTPDQINYLRALARAELAKLALADHNLAAADQLSQQARQEIEAAIPNFDVRQKVYVQSVRADVLWAVGDFDGAKALSLQVRDDLRRYNVPESPERQAAEKRVELQQIS